MIQAGYPPKLLQEILGHANIITTLDPYGHLEKLLVRFAWENRSALGGTRTPNLLIRRSGQVVQGRPSPVVGWADIPELPTCVGCCSAAWLQSWHSRGCAALILDRPLFRPDMAAL
jgi:hypothetical protein